MPWQAKHRFARISPTKVRPVADMVRDRAAQDAVDLLKFAPGRAAGMLAKVLNSALANANEAEADVERLYVKQVRVDQGPTIHRYRPKDRGRVFPIRKRTSHILVVVDEEPE